MAKYLDIALSRTSNKLDAVFLDYPSHALDLQVDRGCIENVSRTPFRGLYLALPIVRHHLRSVVCTYYRAAAFAQFAGLSVSKTMQRLLKVELYGVQTAEYMRSRLSHSIVNILPLAYSMLPSRWCAPHTTLEKIMWALSRALLSTSSIFLL